MRVHVGFEFLLESGTPTPIVSIVRPRGDLHRIEEERLDVTPDLEIHRYRDGFANQAWRWTAPAGGMRVEYHAHVEVSGLPDPQLPELPGTPIDRLPDEMLVYTLPSRYCPSDLVLDDAWQLFGGSSEGWARVQAVCDWIHGNVTYGGQSGSSTTGYESYADRVGVCRDFAHIAVMFCRALNIPARYVCGYLPEIGVQPDDAPMDFHAWFEAYLAGGWHTFDARHNVPRIGRVVVARGRDAVDTAFLTTYGDSRLTSLRVWAEEADESRSLDALVSA
jgi:transglutaminase-like putative cysteine protease